MRRADLPLNDDLRLLRLMMPQADESIAVGGKIVLTGCRNRPRTP
jgi:hypothetical protein